MPKEKRLFLTSLQQTCNKYLYLNTNKCKLVFLLQKSSCDFRVIWLIEACLVSMVHMHLSNCSVYNYSSWFVLLTRRRLPQNAALAPSIEIQIFSAPNAQSKYLENQSIAQLEHGSPRTGAHLSWRKTGNTSVEKRFRPNYPLLSFIVLVFHGSNFFFP